MSAGKHSFGGMCAPAGGGYTAVKTFSVGVFEWIARASGRGVKRGPVKARVKGLTAAPEVVYARAAAICAALDAGTYTGKRNVSVWPIKRDA